MARSTYYLVESHQYEARRCTPKSCTVAGHWEESAREPTLAKAKPWVTMNDAPAVRVYKVTVTETRQLVESGGAARTAAVRAAPARRKAATVLDRQTPGRRGRHAR